MTVSMWSKVLSDLLSYFLLHSGQAALRFRLWRMHSRQNRCVQRIETGSVIGMRLYIFVRKVERLVSTRFGVAFSYSQ